MPDTTGVLIGAEEANVRNPSIHSGQSLDAFGWRTGIGMEQSDAERWNKITRRRSSTMFSFDHTENRILECVAGDIIYVPMATRR